MTLQITPHLEILQFLQPCSDFCSGSQVASHPRMLEHKIRHNEDARCSYENMKIAQTIVLKLDLRLQGRL